jgi:hypothetical protein
MASTLATFLHVTIAMVGATRRHSTELRRGRITGMVRRAAGPTALVMGHRVRCNSIEPNDDF